MNKNILTHILYLTFTGLLISTDSYATSQKERIYQAFATDNWEQWHAEISRSEALDLPDYNAQLNMINLYYGYIGHLIDIKKMEDASTYISKGEILIDKLLEKYPKNAQLQAYKGSFMAFKIPANKLNALKYGFESLQLINNAYSLDAHNIRAIFEKANMLFYSPKIFGGNKKDAVKLFLQVRSRYESQNDTRNWEYLYTLSIIARCYEHLKDFEKANSTYQQILRKEPDFMLVKNKLYPAFIQKAGFL